MPCPGCLLSSRLLPAYADVTNSALAVLSIQSPPCARRLTTDAKQNAEPKPNGDTRCGEEAVPYRSNLGQVQHAQRIERAGPAIERGSAG